ncbi:MAG: hypothetical protein LUE14_02915, partial [Clostridiales bacterium]|nr:hypothetical protein [Clostridiales bacterium]
FMGEIDKLIQSMHTESLSGDGSWANQIRQLERKKETEQILETLKKKETEVNILRQQACDYFDRYGYAGREPGPAGRPVFYEDQLYHFEKALYGMHICYADKTLQFVIPAVLPHRESGQEPAYFKPFCTMLERFIKENPGDYEAARKETARGAVLVIRHSYKTGRLVKDNDNYEIRMIINALHAHQVIRTDRGDYLDIFLTAQGEPGDDQCRIYIMSKETFRGSFYNYSR